MLRTKCIQCEAILGAMRGHERDARVQKEGCEALLFLDANDDSRIKIAEAGSIKAISTGAWIWRARRMSSTETHMRKS